MESVKLNQIRLAHKFIIPIDQRLVTAQKGSEYGNRSFIVGYLDEEGLFIDKNSNKYLNIDLSYDTLKDYYSSIYRNIEKGKSFVNSNKEPLYNSEYTVSKGNIGKLLDFIEKEFYTNDFKAPDKGLVLSKVLEK